MDEVSFLTVAPTAKARTTAASAMSARAPGRWRSPRREERRRGPKGGRGWRCGGLSNWPRTAGCRAGWPLGMPSGRAPGGRGLLPGCACSSPLTATSISPTTWHAYGPACSPCSATTPVPWPVDVLNPTDDFGRERGGLERWLLTAGILLSTIEHTFDSRGGIVPVPAWLSPAPRLHDIDAGWDPVGPPDLAAPDLPTGGPIGSRCRLGREQQRSSRRSREQKGGLGSDQAV